MPKLAVMKRKFLPILFFAGFIISCSTAYKTGQTPDDVYFSPAKYDYDSSRIERRQDNNVYNNSGTVYDDATYEDREIRRRINNRRYRRYDDRYNYPYGYNSYPPVYTNPKSSTQNSTSQPRKTNLGVYTNPSNTSNDTKSNQRNGSGVGNLIRKVISGANSGSSDNSSSSNTYSNNNSNNSSSNKPSNSGNNNSSNNNNSKSSNSSNAPVRKFDN